MHNAASFESTEQEAGCPSQAEQDTEGGLLQRKEAQAEPDTGYGKGRQEVGATAHQPKPPRRGLPVALAEAARSTAWNWRLCKHVFSRQPLKVIPHLGVPAEATGTVPRGVGLWRQCHRGRGGGGRGTGLQTQAWQRPISHLGPCLTCSGTSSKTGEEESGHGPFSSRASWRPV